MSTFDQNTLFMDGIALAAAAIVGPAIAIQGSNGNRQLGKVPGNGLNIVGLSKLALVAGTPKAAFGIITADNVAMTGAAEIIGTREYSLAELQSATQGIFLDFSMAFGDWKEFAQFVVSPSGGTFNSAKVSAFVGGRPSGNYVIADVRSLA